MRKKVFLSCMVLAIAGAYAQNLETMAEPETLSMLDLGSFTGIVAAVSLIVTQLAKAIAWVDKNKYAKIAVSVVTGVGLTFAGEALGVAAFLAGVEWYGVLAYGIGAGLSACGFYDVVKPLLEMMFKKKNTDQ